MHMYMSATPKRACSLHLWYISLVHIHVCARVGARTRAHIMCAYGHSVLAQSCLGTCSVRLYKRIVGLLSDCSHPSSPSLAQCRSSPAWRRKRHTQTRSRYTPSGCWHVRAMPTSKRCWATSWSGLQRWRPSSRSEFSVRIKTINQHSTHLGQPLDAR